MYENFYDDNYLLEEKSTGVFNHMAFKYYIEKIDEIPEEPAKFSERFFIPLKGRTMILQSALNKYNQEIKTLINEISNLKKEKQLNKTKQSKLNILNKRLKTYQERMATISNKMKNLKKFSNFGKEVLSEISDKVETLKSEVAELGNKFKKTGDKKSGLIFSQKSLELKEKGLILTLIKSFINDDMNSYMKLFEKSNENILNDIKELKKQHIEELKTATGNDKINVLRGMKALQIKYYRARANLNKVNNIKKHFLQ